MKKRPHDSFLSFCLHSALFVCTALIINALQSVGKSAFCLHTTCTCLQSFYTYVHSLTLCLHQLTHLHTGINTHVFYTNTCKDISIIVLRPCLVARSLMIVGVVCIGRQVCRLLQLKILSPVIGQPRCYNHLVAHTTVWAKHSSLVLLLLAEQLKASHSVPG